MISFHSKKIVVVLPKGLILIRQTRTVVVVLVVVIVVALVMVVVVVTIPNNKPDIIIRDNEKVTCMLIDVAISGDRNVIKKEAEKILEYKDLTI